MTEPGLERTRVARRQEWSEALVTLTLECAVPDFEAGQFFNLALDLPEGRVKRPFSAASPPGAPLEFLITAVEGGALSSALCALQPGAEVWLAPGASGFFTLEYVPAARDLWLIATGTGLGPFLAMLRTPVAMDRFERVVLVHAARHHSQLVDRVAFTDRAERDASFVYVPVLSRDPCHDGVLSGRIPALLASGELEAAARVELSPSTSHLMLCGNPGMITDAMTRLSERGLVRHRTRKPGHVTIEKYW